MYAYVWSHVTYCTLHVLHTMDKHERTHVAYTIHKYVYYKNSYYFKLLKYIMVGYIEHYIVIYCFRPALPPPGATRAGTWRSACGRRWSTSERPGQTNK